MDGQPMGLDIPFLSVCMQADGESGFYGVWSGSTCSQ